MCGALPRAAQAKDFISQRMNRVITVKGCTGPITTFLIEPFVPHKEEYYLCIQSHRCAGILI